MLRAIALAALVVVSAGGAVDQQAVRLTVTVVLIDAAGARIPVRGHALLVSDYPPSAAPRRIVTDRDGTAGLNLRPGSYIVESDQPVAFEGQGYRWIQTVDVAAGRDTALELNVDNARVGPITASTHAMASGDAEPEDSPADLLERWRSSVVALWTPKAHASGFVIDERGLIVTSQRAVGEATSVEVQLTDTIKVAGTVLVADSERDVAVVRVHPEALTSIPPVPLDCTAPAPTLVDDEDVVTIGVALRGARDMSFGTLRRATPGVVGADFNLRRISAGGPVFAADGTLVGITSIEGDDDEYLRGDSPVVPVDHACAAVGPATSMMADAPPPDGTYLPVEPADTIPMDALEAAVAERASDLTAYEMSSSDFDIIFITPVLAYHVLHGPNGPMMPFSNWSDYVDDLPPVLLVRVTPKQSESFWMKLVRGAAYTQGTSLPPITSFKSGFERLRAFCDEAELTPVHPFTLDLHLPDDAVIHEGLYAFAPDAIGPDCGRVTLELYAEDQPEKGDVREVDPKVLQRIREDFELLER